MCEAPNAHLRVSKKQLAYVVCNTCNSQTMARSDRSDEALRKRHVGAAPVEPVPTAVAPAGDVQTTVTPAAPAPAPAKAKLAWGFGGFAP